MISLTIQYTCERPEMSPKCQWEILKGGVQIGSGTHPAFCSLATEGLFPSIKCLEQLSPLTAAVKTVAVYLHCLVFCNGMHRDNFPFYTIYKPFVDSVV
jgi:hypothetical protein